MAENMLISFLFYFKPDWWELFLCRVERKTTSGLRCRPDEHVPGASDIPIQAAVDPHLRGARTAKPGNSRRRCELR